MPRYSRGDARPADLQVTIVMPPEQVRELTETMIAEMMARCRRSFARATAEFARNSSKL